MLSQQGYMGVANTEKVLIIDDDKVVRKFITKALSGQYEVVCAENGEEGIQRAKKEHPDFILLDIEMPGLNGYEVCDQIKQNAEILDTPVIFLSGRASLQERMLGYEMGGADFIVKPCETQVLLAKLNVLGGHKHDRERLNQKAQQASQAAYTAMRGSSELGLAIQYIESTYNLNSHDSIARKFLDVTSSIGLNCTLMFRTRDGDQYYNDRGTASPLESELMKTLLANGRRFIDFGCRTQINYQRVALLIKNMPLKNPDAYGRYKDFLPTMLGSTDAKLKALDTEAALVQQTRNLTNSFNVVRHTLEQVGASLRGNQLEVLQLLQGMIGELDARIPTLGLEDDQEKYLMSRLDQAIESTQVIIDGGTKANSAFETVCRLLEHLSERQHKLLDEVTLEQPTAQSDEHDQDFSVGGGTELF